MVEIRPVRSHEGALVREVRLRALADSPEAFAAPLEEERALSDNDWAARAEAAAQGRDSVIFLGFDGPRVIALAGGRWHDAERRIAQLWGMWVDPASRGAGVGEALVAAVREWTAQRGGRFVRLGVLSGPREPTGFYERLGFVPTGEERPFTRDPSRLAFWMARPA